MQLLFFLILFFILFFLSRILTSTISYTFMKVTNSYTIAIRLLAVLFLPGVIIHELSHWLIANVLFVQTGTIEFFPQVQGNSVKLGSMQIAKTDIFRRFVIGVAPVVGGFLVMLGVFWFLSPHFFPVTWKTIIFLWVVFEIGNTMFSSSKDLEGAIGFVACLACIVMLLFFLKVPVGEYVALFIHAPATVALLQQLNEFFLIAIGIDVVAVGAFRLVRLR